MGGNPISADTSRQKWYNGGMKVKTSVTLSEELLSAIETQVDTKARSAFIEEATWAYLRTKQRDIRDRKELQAINVHADELNEEALDVLEYQVDE